MGFALPARQPSLVTTSEDCAQIELMLNTLPDEDDPDFDDLSDWERDFLPNIRERYDRRGDLSDGQYRSLEKLYEKYLGR